MLILDTNTKSETRFRRSASQFVEPTALVKDD